MLKELGNTVVESAVSSSGMGQLTLYVNKKGLEKLRYSDQVRRVMADPGRSEIYEDPKQLARMQEAAQRDGSVAVSVLLHADDLVLPKDPRGKAAFRSGADAGHQSKVSAFLDSLPAESIKNLGQVASSVRALIPGANIAPEINLVVDQKGLLHLLNRKDIRNLRTTVEDRAILPAVLDPKAITAARKDGEARVILTLRRPSGYSPDKGRMSKKAWAAQAESLKEDLEEVVGALDQKALRKLEVFEGVGSAVVTLPFNALSKLYASPDARVETVKLDDVKATPQLMYSTSAVSAGGMNVKRLWEYNNIRGAGQWIAIFDTGVERTHPFLSGKYVGEACYGTNDSTYVSLCPGQDSTGASVPGSYGAAAPCGGSNFNWVCYHGTAAAGIAGGRNGIYGMNGVAPDADFFFVNIFSKQKTSGILETGERDILRGLDLIARLGPSWPGRITVNLSMGFGGYSSVCDSYYPQTVRMVALLKSMNIPVIASSGNDGRRNEIKYPACISGVIKASSSDKYDGAVAYTSDAASSAAFGWSNATGPVFLAPGTFIQTSTLGGGYSTYSGTSFAAPHVAGAYALVKSIIPTASVNDITNYIALQASVSVNVPVPAGIAPYTLQRIKLPNY